MVQFLMFLMQKNCPSSMLEIPTLAAYSPLPIFQVWWGLDLQDRIYDPERRCFSREWQEQVREVQKCIDGPLQTRDIKLAGNLPQMLLYMCRSDLESVSYAPPPQEDAPKRLLFEEISGSSSKVYRMDPMQTTYTKCTGNLTLLPASQQSL